MYYGDRTDRLISSAQQSLAPIARPQRFHLPFSLLRFVGGGCFRRRVTFTAKRSTGTLVTASTCFLQKVKYIYTQMYGQFL